MLKLILYTISFESITSTMTFFFIKRKKKETIPLIISSYYKLQRIERIPRIHTSFKEAAEGKGLYHPIKISNFFQPIPAISPSKLGARNSGILEQPVFSSGKEANEDILQLPIHPIHPLPLPRSSTAPLFPLLAFLSFPFLLKIILPLWRLATSLLTLIRRLARSYQPPPSTMFFLFPFPPP